MDFLGIGSLELLLILVIALVFLGPTRLVDFAKSVGKTVREVRRAAGEAVRAIEDEASVEESPEQERPASAEQGSTKEKTS